MNLFRDKAPLETGLVGVINAMLALLGTYSEWGRSPTPTALD